MEQNGSGKGSLALIGQGGQSGAQQRRERFAFGDQDVLGVGGPGSGEGFGEHVPGVEWPAGCR